MWTILGPIFRKSVYFHKKHLHLYIIYTSEENIVYVVLHTYSKQFPIQRLSITKATKQSRCANWKWQPFVNTPCNLYFYRETIIVGLIAKAGVSNVRSYKRRTVHNYLQTTATSANPKGSHSQNTPKNIKIFKSKPNIYKYTTCHQR